MQQDGREDRARRDHSEAAGHSGLPAALDPPALADDSVKRRGVRIDVVGQTAEPDFELPFILTAHSSPPSRSVVLDLSLARPRAVWLLTFPTEQPRIDAVSDSDRSSQYLSTTAARCPWDSRISSCTSSARSSR